MKKVYIYKGFERFWHWTQAALIILLGITGFEIHGFYAVFGFENAVEVHNIAALALVVLIIFAIFWHLTTGEWRQYMPTTQNLKAQANYYITGIFKNAPHPTRKTLLSKLNPLQRLVYLALKIFLIPLMVITGLLYLFYRYPYAGQIRSLGLENIELVALLHTIGAFAITAFIIVHIYLITTGHTLTSNLKAMITGWEELDEKNVDDNQQTPKNPKQYEI